jgi:hypothetical protein
MQRPAGLVDEQLRGAAVGQPRAAGERADVAGGRSSGRARAQARQEHRAGATGGDQAWQQPGAARAEEQPVDITALRACAGALGGDVEVLDVQAQDLVGAGGGLVQHAPERAFAQVDVAALPQPLEARSGDAAGVVVLLGAALEGDVAVDLENPGALAVARERADGRDVAVPCRRRCVMPALFDDAGEARAGDRRVAELVLEHGERLAVLRARRGREVGLRQERVDRHGQVDAGCDGEAERGPAAGGGHDRCSTARPPRRPGPAPGDFAGNVSSSRTSNWRAGAPGPAAPRDQPGFERSSSRGMGPFPAAPTASRAPQSAKTGHSADLQVGGRAPVLDKAR